METSPMLCRLILPDWAKGQGSPDVLEGEFSDEQVKSYNDTGYNCFFFPNYPSIVRPNTPVSGTDVDTFQFVFVDMDLKSGTHASKEAFIAELNAQDLAPTSVIDSGNGIHAYWQVSDLSAMSFLRLQRRLMRHFNTDPAVSKLCQIMRLPGTINTKDKSNPKLCEAKNTTEKVYTCENLDNWLPAITVEDETYCKNHYDKTYNTEDVAKLAAKLQDSLPLKFRTLVKSNEEVRDLFSGDVEDRSRADYRLAHILFAEGYNKEEALSVLGNVRKAMERAPIHRYNYAKDIIDKIWIFEETKDEKIFSSSVKDILKRGIAKHGTRFPCDKIFDATKRGFRLGDVLGLVGGSGSGKTTLTLNYFYHFTRLNPDYVHLFVSLEQPEEEIAERWVRITNGNDGLHDKVHVLGNYNPDGSHRKLSLSDIQDYVFELEKSINCKVGCVVIDHIGALAKKGKNDETQGLMDICHAMKAFAKSTNTFLVMQSQTNREKAGIGDLELNKDAAFGTSMFEWYCDFLVTTWQPLKRIYEEVPHMCCSAFKYCKIRHKNVREDKTKEDVVHVLMFDVDTEMLDTMTELQEKAYPSLNKKALTLINKDRKREPTIVKRITWADKAGESNE